MIRRMFGVVLPLLLVIMVIIGVPCANTAFAQPVSSVGLIGLYTFEDGTANNMVSGAEALPDLVSSGCEISSGDAIIDSGLDYLELPVPLGTSPFTVWIDATYQQSTGHTMIISQGLPTLNSIEDYDLLVMQFVIFGVSPNRVRTGFAGAGSGQELIDTGIGMMDGSRHRIAATWDGTNMGAFFDGSLQTTSVEGWPDIDGTAVRFGASEWGSSASLGHIHEIRVYNRALSEAELGGSTDPDSDGDGVPDDQDQCPNTPALVAVDANGCPEWRSDIQIGDILLSRSDSGFSKSLGLIHEWTHAGIYIGGDELIESDLAGVHYSNITDWDDPNLTWVTALTVKNDDGSPISNDVRAAIVEFAVDQEGKLYDPQLWQKSDNPNSLMWYCSELVWAAYQQQDIELEPNPDAWYENTVISPQELFEDNNTHEIPGGNHKTVRPSFAADISDLWAIIWCPVDIEVTDPDGLVISKTINEIPGATYVEVDVDNDGEPDDQVIIPNKKNGHYSITVVPEPDATSSDTFTLQISIGDTTLTLAQNEPVGEAPSEPFTILSTDDGVVIVSDSDGDGIPDDQDTCPNDAENDIDGDGICGDVDNCPYTSNRDQADVCGATAPVPEVATIVLLGLGLAALGTFVWLLRRKVATTV